MTTRHKKRILVFSLAYFPHASGAEIAVKEITDRISPDNFSFDIVALRFEKDFAAAERIGNCAVYRTRVPLLPLRFQKLLFPFAAFLKASSLHRKNKYDAVWSIMASFAGFAALFFSYCFPKVPFLLTLQEGENFSRREGVFKPFFRKIFRRASHIQVISTFLAKWAKDMGAQCPVEVVPNGVDIRAFSVRRIGVREEIRKKLGFSENDIVLVTTSRLVKKNAVGDVIQALQFLPENIKFLIVGTGFLESELKLIVKRLMLNSRVRFVGFISHAELPDYLHASDIFIRTPISEGFGSSFVEAMAVGLPVIATPVGGIVDFIRDSETGLFINTGDPKAIARKISRLIENPVLRETIVRNASRMVYQKYDWDLIASAVVKLFTDLTK